ncbi:MAG: cytidylate kinase family protein [Candidatus Binataceae bacterium]
MAVIAISNQLGSRGIEVGEQCARMLGYRFVTSADLVNETAQRYGVSADQLLVFDERAPHFWEWFTTDTRNFVAYIRAVILSELARDRVIVAGRSIAHIMPQCGCGLRVRTVGPFPERAHRVAQDERLAPPAAERRVRDYDRELRARTQSLSGVNIDDNSIYDLVVNTSSLPLDSLAEGLAALARSVDSHAHASNWRAMHDAAVTAQVRAALVAHPKIRDARIDVACSAGCVRLTGAGLVPPWNELVESVAREVQGVASVEISTEEPPLPPYSPA